MTFTARNLSVLNYAQGFTQWHYKAIGVPLATALAPHFFDDARDMIADGDMMLISAQDGGIQVYFERQEGRIVPRVMARTAA
jgi:hypothetical protein